MSTFYLDKDEVRNYGFTAHKIVIVPIAQIPPNKYNIRIAWQGLPLSLSNSAICAFGGSALNPIAAAEYIGYASPLFFYFIFLNVFYRCRSNEEGQFPRCMTPLPVHHDPVARNVKWRLPITSPCRLSRVSSSLHCIPYLKTYCTVKDLLSPVYGAGVSRTARYLSLLYTAVPVIR